MKNKRPEFIRCLSRLQTGNGSPSDFANVCATLKEYEDELKRLREYKHNARKATRALQKKYYVTCLERDKALGQITSGPDTEKFDFKIREDH